MSQENTQTLKRTPAYSLQLEAGARMTPFTGWELPLQFSGIKYEHQAVRERAGLFDVSHMGEILVAGQQAEAMLNFLTCNDVTRVTDNQAQYSALLNEKGGVIDDLIIYRFSLQNYLLCVNAANVRRVYQWLKERNCFDATVENVSAEFGQLALQGRHALEIAGRLSDSKQLSQLKPFSFTGLNFSQVPVVVARTGYTGEDGLELFVPWQHLSYLWQVILDAGRDLGIVPVGLGARDTLRLEACYPLHGHELSEEVTALESGLEWIVKFDKGDFIGKSALLEQKNFGVPRALVALVVTAAGIVRSGDLVFNQEGEEVGVVTSGTKTATVNKAIGLAFVARDYAKIGEKLFVDVRGRLLAVELVRKPFFKR